MGISPEAVVRPPATERALHGLLDSANVVVEPDSRWEGGFVFQPENCIMSEVWIPCGADSVFIISLTVAATGGTWAWDNTGNEGGSISDPIPWDATADEVGAAIEQSGWPPSQYEVLGGPAGTFGQGQLTPFIIMLNSNSTDIPFLGPQPVDIDLADFVDFDIVPLQIPGFLEPPDVKKDYDGDQSPLQYQPFVVEVPYTCSSWGFEANDYRGKALRQLAAGTGKAIEREFWTGELNLANINLRYWTPAANIVNPGGWAAPVAVNPALGLALLEQALGVCSTGSRGMIHTPPVVAERLAQWYLIDDDPACDEGECRMLTRSRGDIVIVGSGYDRTVGPFAAANELADTEAWIYATGMVDIRLGEPMIYPETMAEALDRATNTVTYRGERTAAVNPDGCCMFAVLVDFEEALV